MEVSPIVSRAGNLSLVGGALALDFANTAGGRETAEPIEHLQRVDHVVDWAAHAGGVDAATAERSRAAIARDPAVAEGVLRSALRLRAAIYAIGSAIARGTAPPPAELATLKGIARSALGPAELAPARGGGYAFDFAAAPVGAALLGPVAWSAVELLAAGGFERLKQCPGHDCGWLFLDASKNNSRRWCDMATCGNRTKAQRHRERR